MNVESTIEIERAFCVYYGNRRDPKRRSSFITINCKALKSCQPF